MIKKGGGNTQKQDAGMVIGKHAGVYQQAQGRMYAVKLLIGEGHGGTRTGQGRKIGSSLQDKIGAGHESQGRDPQKEIQNGAPHYF